MEVRGVGVFMLFYFCNYGILDLYFLGILLIRD